MAHLILTKQFSQPSPDTAMLLSPFKWTYLPLPVPPSITSSDVMKLKVSRCIYYDSLVVKRVNYGVLSTAILVLAHLRMMQISMEYCFFDQTSVIDVHAEPRFSTS